MMDIILIAGLWLDASVWADTATSLDRLGHRPVPVSLPGQGDGATTATLDAQVDAVLAAVDAAERPVVVGHSAACSLAWLAADRRPAAVSRVVLIGGFPASDGSAYADFFDTVDGVMPFPGWGPFEGPDSRDLDASRREAIAATTIPVPEGVSKGTVRLSDERRFEVPTTLICPEFSPEEARQWIRAGEIPELSKARHLEFVDVDSGHWPMFTRPDELARLLDTIATEG